MMATMKPQSCFSLKTTLLTIIEKKRNKQCNNNLKNWTAVNESIKIVPTPVTNVATSLPQTQIENISSSDTISFDNFKVKKFADGATAIVYKEGNTATKSGNNIIHKIINKRYKEIAPPDYRGYLASVVEEGHLLPEPRTYNGLLLIELDTKRWIIYDNITDTQFAPDPHQTYIFVTMADKSIRIAPALQGGHALLSENAKYIRFAGEVQFNEKGQIEYWNNQSGGYYPSPYLAHQAGLKGGAARFHKKYDRNDPTIAAALIKDNNEGSQKFSYGRF
jgi:hypothetical protein